MRPVNDAASGVPFVLSIELDQVARSKRCDPGGQVYVVGDQKGLTGLHPQDEPLMSAAIVVIGENLHNLALALNLNVALPAFVGG